MTLITGKSEEEKKLFPLPHQPHFSLSTQLFSNCDRYICNIGIYRHIGNIGIYWYICNIGIYWYIGNIGIYWYIGNIGVYGYIGNIGMDWYIGKLLQQYWNTFGNT